MYESKKVVEAVREIVKENPEATYYKTADGCLYTKGKGGNGCGCLIGQAIIRAYPELEERLKDLDEKIGPSADTLIKTHLNFTETKYSQWLAHAQFKQDGGWQWESCVESADEYHPLPF